MYAEAQKRSQRYLKYAMREYRKYRIRHQRYMESNLCKAITKKGHRCEVVTDSTYCNVHKHLDSTIKEETPVLKKKLDVTAITNDLMHKYHNVESREYHGDKSNPLKHNKVRDAYRDERHDIERVYRKYINLAATSDDLDDIYERVDESIKEIRDRTDETILLIETEEDTSELAKIIAELEKEKSKLVRREYKGPMQYPHVMKMINDICNSELKAKIDIYEGIASAISFRDFETEYDEIQEFLSFVKPDIKQIEKKTEEKLKAVMPRKKNPSKHY
ncbi:hypothetical protein INT43_004956 [Umbelopsis isabellina]|uniref:Uncharacterized protein n=1 Tax=Mortierella isabellina TaxID=91625 RepID=A0A8H7PEY6_MORIS|nr:hypothetical protein INT43_004956 [Umbelopsis isabellina]